MSVYSLTCIYIYTYMDQKCVVLLKCHNSLYIIMYVPWLEITIQTHLILPWYLFTYPSIPSQILNEEITPTLRKLKEERSSYLEYQKVMRELEHLSRLSIAFQFVQAEVRGRKMILNIKSLCMHVVRGRELTLYVDAILNSLPTWKLYCWGCNNIHVHPYMYSATTKESWLWRWLAT